MSSLLRVATGYCRVVVLSPEEVFTVIRQTTGIHRIMLQLLYGSGLRLRECMQLRIKDIDFAQSQIIVRSGKGGKDRVTLLPKLSSNLYKFTFSKCDSFISMI